MSNVHHTPLCRIAALALLPLFLGSQGCRSWQVQQPPIAPHIEEGPDIVRLTLVDGRTVELLDPSVRNDSVVGALYGGPRSSEGIPTGASQGAPLEDIAQIELRKTDGRGVLLFVLGAMGAVWAIGAVADASSNSF